MIERHLMKLRARDEIDAEEERAIREAVAEIRDYPADRVFIRADEPLTVCSLLLDGIACRYKDLRDGQRQITELQVAGDFTDLHSFTLKRLDHHVMALTPCRIAIVPHEAIREITERHPHLTRVYWFATNLDAAIHREWELSLGRRTAVSRLAALLCELQVRLEIVGLADEGGYDLPLSQAELAECLGLTSVHINRMLRELRERGLAELRDRRVTLHDLAALRRAGEFSTSYLYLEQRPR